MKTMKKLTTSVIVGLMLTIASARAQNVTNAPSSSSFLGDIASGLSNVTNWMIAPYATYAPDAPKKFGGGALFLYNINNYVGAGPGIDWLGEFNLVSANITLKFPLHPLVGFGYSNITTTPFVVAGIATPISGAGKANGQVATLEGAGINIDLFKISRMQFGVGYAFDTWTGAGPYSGKHHQIFFQGHMGF